MEIVRQAVSLAGMAKVGVGQNDVSTMFLGTI